MENCFVHSTVSGIGLIEEVKVCLDENVSSEALATLGDVDTLTLDQIIESKVADGARLTILDAPHHMLDGGESFKSQPVERKGSDGIVPLPEDFLRLVVFQMSDWSLGITDAVTEDSADYLLQTSKWKGIRGNVERPVVAITHQDDGRVLEFFGCDSTSATIKRALYIPMPEIDNNTIKLCSLLHRATVYRIASLVALAIGDRDAAAAMLKTSNELAAAGAAANNDQA